MKYLILLILMLVGCGPVAVVDRLPDGTPILIRSPQPDADDLHDLVESYKIKTVLNLRGERLSDWYLEESLACTDLKLKLVNLKASGRSPPNEEEAQIFLDLINDPSNYPILMHCQGGIHRTGAYVALYRLAIQHRPPLIVLRELEKNYFDWTTQDRSAIKRWILQYRD